MKRNAHPLLSLSQFLLFETSYFSSSKRLIKVFVSSPKVAKAIDTNYGCEFVLHSAIGL